MSFPTPEGIQTYHNKPYPAIDVTRPELSAAGKVVVVTGGGTGLGLAFAEHFAKAGSKKVAITGRRGQVLDEAKKKIEGAYPGTTVLTLQSDVADRAGVEAAFQKTKETFGPINVLINNAAHLSAYKNIGQDSSDDWWAGFETNVKGSHNVLCAFLKTSAPDATLINLASGAVNAIIPGQSAYMSSKVAATRLFEAFQAENPGYRVVTIAPGVVLTAMHAKTVEAFEQYGWPQLPLDDSKHTNPANK
jgi:NAD(P)-dependent dehydrogenase (short-subunit alcohol dehydrogenase family)